MKEDLKDLFANSSSQDSNCKGIYFRYSKSEFWSNHLDSRVSIEKRESYRILKRMSCNGMCGKRCMRDFFEEDISACGFDGINIMYPENPKHGDIYFLEFIPGPKDWQTGYVEDWKWIFKKVNE